VPYLQIATSELCRWIAGAGSYLDVGKAGGDSYSETKMHDLSWHGALPEL